jgi:hypothetical protein
MPLPTVWSEAPEIAGVRGLHDCTQSAALMALIYAGKTSFPLGIYTVAERNALDASDDRPDNTGATLDGHLINHGWLDKQVLNRYGIRMPVLPDDEVATLRRFLSTPGYAFLLQGSMGSLPAGHPLRQWQPEFSGGHAVTVITGTQPRWLDPLAPMGYRGTLTDVDTILRFAWDGRQYSRYMKKDELVVVPDTSTEGDMKFREILYATPRDIRCVPPFKGSDVSIIRAYRPPVHEVVKSATPTKPTHFWAKGEAEVTGWSKTDPNKVFNYWIGDDAKGGYFAGLYVAKSDLTQPGEFDPIPGLQIELDKATRVGAAAENKRWADWLAQHPK